MMVKSSINRSHFFIWNSYNRFSSNIDDFTDKTSKRINAGETMVKTRDVLESASGGTMVQVKPPDNY